MSPADAEDEPTTEKGVTDTEQTTWFFDAGETAEVPVQGRTIGPFAVIRILGRGGMGVVYEAEQRSPRRTVALKVMLAGHVSPAILRRFEYEAQILGKLQHPGIAQVYEAGTFEAEDGSVRPYFAMELVAGRTLTAWTEGTNPSVEMRLELLARVCDAVDHAHQRGIIHRDLKPGNVLVDESGRPKILDFGIARITDADVKTTTLTEMGQIVGTLPYMSPEQVRGDPSQIDTRTDVYALGVLGFQLLSGRLPLDLERRSVPEIARIICDEEPSSLSSVSRAYRGDVETIIAKALAKDKERRYSSAALLAADLRAHLRHEPIQARPPSALYQLGKFAKRHKGLVAGLILTFLSLVAGLCVATSYYLQADAERIEADVQRAQAEAQRIEAERARDEAKAQADIASATIDFLTRDVLATATPDVSRGQDLTVREAVGRAALHVQDALAGQPLVEGTVRGTLGHVYNSLGDYAAAERQLERALELLPPSAPVGARLNMMRDLGVALLRLGRLGDAERTLADAIGRAEESYGPADAHVGYSLNLLGAAYEAGAKFDRAREMYERSLSLFTEHYGEDHTGALAAAEYLGSLEKRLGDHARAQQIVRRILAIRRRDAGSDSPTTLRTIANLITLLLESNEPDEAEELNEELRELAARVHGPEHMLVARSHANAGRIALGRGDPIAALGCFRRALGLYRKDEVANARSIVSLLGRIGRLEADRGDLDAAESTLTEALELARRTCGEESIETAERKQGLASIHHRRRRLDRAEELLEEALETTQALAPESLQCASICNDLGLLLKTRGDLEEAEDLLRESLDLTRKLRGPLHPSTAAALENLGNVIGARGRHDEVRTLLREVLDIRREGLGDEHPATGRTYFNLGFSYARTGDYEKALPLQRRALAITRAAYGDDHAHVAIVATNLAETLGKLDRPGEMERIARLAADVARRRRPPEKRTKPLLLLADSLERLGRKDEAKPLREEAARLGGGTNE